MRMKFSLLIVALVLAIAGCSSAPTINVTGTWEGTLTGPGGQLGYRLVLLDNNGTLSGDAFLFDADLRIWRDAGPVTGRRDGPQASMTNILADGSGKLEIIGTFSDDSFKGSAAVYDSSGAYLGTLTIGLTKKQ